MPFLCVVIVLSLAGVFKLPVLLTVDPLCVQFDPPSGPSDPQKPYFCLGNLLIVDKSAFLSSIKMLLNVFRGSLGLIFGLLGAHLGALSAALGRLDGSPKF